ncbi:hypothetical protein ACHAPQ_011043 [Fusarium lateritium]
MASAQEAEQIIIELNGGYKLGAHVHDSAAKLLFNLLLLTDEKSFTKAASNNSVPSISFEIHPKHIIVDCNEDGLTKSDLESICKATTDKEATTTAAIFKSIVTAADKVHIQSGNFSLEFRHNRVDPKEVGLKPVWAPAAKEIPNLTTRMTIYLHDHGDKSDVSRLNRSVMSQFIGLDGICLLFLRTLEQVTMRWYEGYGMSFYYKTKFYKKMIAPSRVSLKTSSSGKVGRVIKCLFFHIQRNSDVTLAFPLKRDGTLSVSSGKIFNILPFRASMYNFHIHGRFEMDEKHQYIDPESPLNLLYRLRVENALIQAIQTFCADPKLRYQWPLFLPLQPGETTFWKDLDTSIHAWIQQNPVFQSRNLKQLRLIHHVITLAGDAIDHDKIPLLDDPTTDPFLSPNYSSMAIDRMREYGLRNMRQADFIDLVALDLNSDNSRMRQETSSNEWHKAVVGALSRVPQDTPSFRRMKELPLLPLKDGTWATVESGPVVFPSIGDADIPEIPNLRAICSSASRIPERVLFESCGVLVPDEVTPTWADLSSCVWNGPPETITVHSLKRIYMSRITKPENRKKIEKFLHVSLGIWDTTVDNLTAELTELRRVRCEDPRRILSIYRYWNAQLDVNHGTRALFEQRPLIFAKKQGNMGWYKIQDCVWPSNTSLGGKAILSDIYGDLKEFFVDKLGVEDSMPNKPYDELKQPSQRSVRDIKDTIIQFSKLLRTTTVFLDPEPIRKSKIFPVKGPNGTVSLSSVDTDFAIRDTLFYEDGLGPLSLLDFDMKEFRRLKPFFSWLGIEDRYLSRRVEEQTSVPNLVGSSMASGPRYFKRKSYYILRIAAAFDSCRFSKDAPGLRKQLRNMQIIEIEGITAVERTTQNGQVRQTTTREAYCHFVEFPERLVIYVPKENKAQEICFRTFLPRKLAGWLMHPEGQKQGNVDFEMVNALTSLLASDEASIDDLLYSLSIPNITDTLPDGTLDETDTYSDEEEEHDTERGDSKEEDESDEGFETCDDLFEDGPIPQGSETHEASPEVVPSTPKAPVETGPSQSEVNLALRPSNAASEAHTSDKGDISGLSQVVNVSEQDRLPTPQVATN